MKVLVTYFSQSGNTEQIAKAICEEASKGHEAQLKKVDEVQAEDCSNYDVIFVGSPVHAGGLSAQASELMNGLPQSPRFKLAGFLTHSAPAYEPTNFERALKALEDTSKEKGISFLGTYDCQGRLAKELHDMIKQVKGLSDEEFAETIKQMDPHPSAEDEQKAREFARDVLSKI